MNTSSKWQYNDKTGKILLWLLLAALFTVIGALPASARNDKHKGKHDRGRYEQRGHDRGHDRGRHMHDRRVYRSYGHREVYLPPPVIFVPPPPPGIHLFLPPVIIHP